MKANRNSIFKLTVWHLWVLIVSFGIAFLWCAAIYDFQIMLNDGKAEWVVLEGFQKAAELVKELFL